MKIFFTMTLSMCSFSLLAAVECDSLEQTVPKKLGWIFNKYWPNEMYLFGGYTSDKSVVMKTFEKKWGAQGDADTLCEFRPVQQIGPFNFDGKDHTFKEGQKVLLFSGKNLSKKALNGKRELVLRPLETRLEGFLVYITKLSRKVNTHIDSTSLVAGTPNEKTRQSTDNLIIVHREKQSFPRDDLKFVVQNLKLYNSSDVSNNFENNTFSPYRPTKSLNVKGVGTLQVGCNVFFKNKTRTLRVRGYGKVTVPSFYNSIKRLSSAKLSFLVEKELASHVYKIIDITENGFVKVESVSRKVDPKKAISYLSSNLFRLAPSKQIGCPVPLYRQIRNAYRRRVFERRRALFNIQRRKKEALNRRKQALERKKESIRRLKNANNPVLDKLYRQPVPVTKQY